MDKMCEGEAMTFLESRVKQLDWTLLERSKITGLHSGNISRITIMDKQKNSRKLIYKELAVERKNELNIYKKLLAHLNSLMPDILIIDSQPEAMFIQDLGTPIKKSFQSKSTAEKRILLDKIMLSLLSLHSGFDVSTVSYKELPHHEPTSEWFSWAVSQFTKLADRHVSWYQADWLQIVKETEHIITTNSHSPRSHLTLTHGDPHLENIFLQDGTIYFIDWEWAAVAPPGRDITILLQDVYDKDLANYVQQKYFQLLKGKEIGRAHV
jgi:hypothetical protein